MKESSTATLLPVGISEALGLEVQIRDPEYAPPPPSNRGRPRAAIPWEVAALYMFSGVPLREVAAACNVGLRTLRDRCPVDNGYPLSEFRERFDSQGRAALQVAQTLAALGGDPRMLAFVGMNRLGQSRKVDRHNTHSGAVALYDPSADARLAEGLPVAQHVIGLPRNGKEAPPMLSPADSDAALVAELEAETDAAAIEPSA